MKSPSINVKAWSQERLFPFEHLRVDVQVHVDVETQTVTVGMALHDHLTDDVLEMFTMGTCTITELGEYLWRVGDTIDALVLDYVSPFGAITDQ